MSPQRFEKLAFGIAVVVIVVVLFLPLVSVSLYEVMVETKEELAEAGEATVGIAVLIRAMARRWLRTGSRSLIRSSVGAYSRTAVRTMTRRVIKSGTRVVAGAIVKDSIEEDVEATDEPIAAQTRRRSFIGVTTGFVALAISFVITMAVLSEAEVSNVLERGLTLVTAAILAGVPIIFYWMITAIAARPLGVKVTCQTAIDGLFIQAYFSGAGSFLPMTTDVAYEGGSEKSQGWLAVIVIAGLYAIHLGLVGLNQMVGSYTLEFAASMFLAYCFVFAFPIRPLEGHHVWRLSKLLWLAVFIPILLSFRLLPPAFGAFI